MRPTAYLTALDGELPDEALQFLRNEARVLQNEEGLPELGQILRDGDEIRSNSLAGAGRVVTARYARST